jgi:hypothetical protein
VTISGSNAGGFVAIVTSHHATIELILKPVERDLQKPPPDTIRS